MDPTEQKALRTSLMGHLEALSCDRNPYFTPQNHLFAQHYIRSELAVAGPVIDHEFKAQGKQHHNWIVQLPGQRPQRPPVLVGAHYDTVPGSPGADDNASGVAVLLSLARYFATHSPTSPLWLVAFDLEEYGLAGSQALAARLRHQQQPLRLMLSLEMLGYADKRPNSQRYPPGLKYFYPAQGDFIALIGSWRSGDCWQLRRRFRASGMPCEYLPVWGRGQWLPDTRRSDHAPFWDAGYRAAMLTDTANLRNPHYHQPSDTLETLDLDFLTRVALALRESLRHL